MGALSSPLLGHTFSQRKLELLLVGAGHLIPHVCNTLVLHQRLRVRQMAVFAALPKSTFATRKEQAGSADSFYVEVTANRWRLTFINLTVRWNKLVIRVLTVGIR